MILATGCGGKSDDNDTVVQREADDDNSDRGDSGRRILRSADCYDEGPVLGPDTRDEAYKLRRERTSGQTNSEIFFYDCRTTNDCVGEFEVSANRQMINGEEQVCYTNSEGSFNACTTGEVMIVDNEDGTALELATFQGSWNGSRHTMYCETDYPRP